MITGKVTPTIAQQEQRWGDDREGNGENNGDYNIVWLDENPNEDTNERLDNKGASKGPHKRNNAKAKYHNDTEHDRRFNQDHI